MEIDKWLDSGRLEKMDCRASQSLVFGGLMDKTYERIKKRNFNCRRGTKIVDINHMVAIPALLKTKIN